MTLCSVIIPAFNVGPYIGQAIHSALNQTVTDLEVIVVNDGSTDDTPSRIAAFGENVIHIEQPRSGLGAARNAGLDRAKGEFIALLDGDDWWMPERLASVVAYLRTSPDVGFATTNAFLVVGSDITKRTYYRTVSYRWSFQRRNQPEWIVIKNFIMSMVVIRRRLFDRWGTFDESLEASEDWDLWMRFILAGERVGLVDRPLAFYRRRREALSADERQMLATRDLVLVKALQRPDIGTRPRLQKLIQLRRGVLFRQRGDKAAARKLLSEVAHDGEAPVLMRAASGILARLP